MGGNESRVRVRLGQSDANRGLALLNDGKGNFTYLPQHKSGLNLVGDVRSIVPVGNKIFFGITDDKVKAFQF